MIFKRLLGLLGKDLAMDLGTANTLLYTPKDGIVLNEPSVVAMDAYKGNIIAVGREAKDFLGRTPERINAIRPMKDGVIADFEVTKEMISFFIKKAIKGLSLVKPRIVICVPTGITQVEKRAVIESALQAGVREVKLVEEPMAAAIGAGLPIEEPIGNMVVDIGGGTTEVAVISLSAVAYAESARVAGDEMNEAVQRYFQDKFQMLIGENQAERVKMTLGSAHPLPETLHGEVSGKNMVDGTPRRIEVTDAQIREAIHEPVAAIVMAVKRALEKTPPELVGDIATNGLLLAGGGALLKGLDVLLSRETNLSVIVDDDPLTTVVRGTGRTLDDIKTYGKVYIN
ncbi:rod shape-determining protein [Desulfovibrio ferrophilus]|uniref:Cell shape-determining protein MreB n=1 Tax=Desulfovibrio ferrophilus TaxID=241368 RepID=A0A2Z6AWR5_9BACT|nr:rod shape-determining protein [Desulfovibrio ferrophilus]BBD07645.1 rod shape-determining protein MreB [Desulfovibrio ferrophilus]